MLYNLIFFELKYWPQHVNSGKVSDREAADMTLALYMNIYHYILYILNYHILSIFL